MAVCGESTAAITILYIMKFRKQYMINVKAKPIHYQPPKLQSYIFYKLEYILLYLVQNEQADRAPTPTGWPCEHCGFYQRYPKGGQDPESTCNQRQSG